LEVGKVVPSPKNTPFPYAYPPEVAALFTDPIRVGITTLELI
jgi:hypothetical protein